MDGVCATRATSCVFNWILAFMPSDSANSPQSTATTPALVSETEHDATIVTDHFAGSGWKLFEEMARELDWRHSRLTAALRWLRQESPLFIVESKLSLGVAKVRITQATTELKQARQLSADIIPLLAKLYTKLKHTDRDREKLSYDVRTIAARLAPFLESREFQIQYRRFKRQLGAPHQEIPMEAGAESNNPLTSPVQSRVEPHVPGHRVTPSRAESPRSLGFDRRALQRLVFIASVIVVGSVITVFLTAALLHALEVLSQYVERINAQSQL